MIALEDEVRALRGEVVRLQHELGDAVERTHRQYRRDLVVLRQSPEVWRRR